MQTRAVRLTLLALLLVAGLGAGLFVWDSQQRLDLLLTAERDVDARLDRLARNVAAFGAAQQAAVVPGQVQGDALAHGAALLRQVDEDLAALRSRSRSTAGVAAFSAFADALEAAVKTDSRAREHLRIGQELMAADLVLTEGRQSIETLGNMVAGLRRAEQSAIDEERQDRRARAATALGATALLWVLGLFALARVPAAPRRSEDAGNRAPGHDHDGSADLRPPPARHDRQHASADARDFPPVNMAEAASVCTALSRVASAAEIPSVLARAADVLDASGIIVWMGAGEDLFAATSHGYHPRVLSRLGPIRRHSENATAAAWRACELRVVAGDRSNNGAIVAPLFGPSTSLGPWSDGCIGVLTVEIRHGRENDPTTQAVAAMFGAQLATVLAAWPAPSAVEAPARVDDGRESSTREVPSEAADDPTAASA
jgi:hypothetical protein